MCFVLKTCKSVLKTLRTEYKDKESISYFAVCVVGRAIQGLSVEQRATLAATIDNLSRMESASIKLHSVKESVWDTSCSDFLNLISDF